MLEKIRKALRIANTSYDDEITDIINAAKADLALSGVSAIKLSDDDPSIIQAITLYARAHFGINNEESEKYRSAYESKKIQLCLSAEYAEV